LLKIAALANNTVEIMNSPEKNPSIPVTNNSPINISLFLLIVSLLNNGRKQNNELRTNLSTNYKKHNLRQ
jgi:hypothetical protein